ncbi:MAG TPA: hypothetical protein VLF19_08655 [Methylomirabilota bacterium]|nr:hypothetical protein [Methylomirabilota bacterium]
MYEILGQIVGGLVAAAAFVGLVVYRTWQERKERRGLQQRGRGAEPETAAPRHAG